ncbi:hypothetical protein ACOSQ4_016887 [Xanthoceras sorbifolium]
MWVLTVTSLLCLRHFIKFNTFGSIHFQSAVTHLKLVSSHSDVNESNAYNERRARENGTILELSTNEVIETLKFLRKEPKKALSFFEQLTRIRFSHDVYTYAAIVRILYCWGSERKVGFCDVGTCE